MLALKDINLRISQKFSIQDINLSVNQGERFALLGPNGMGKSTLIDIMTETIRPDSGTVRIGENSFHKMKHDIGVLYEYTPMFYYSTVKEILAYLCVIHNVAFDHLAPFVEKLQMQDKIGSLSKVLSKGERRKAGILFALVHDPSILILDEPTAGMDPFMRDSCWQIFKTNGRTIFFTTHYWDEAAEHADKIAFIVDGRIIGVDSPKAFLSNHLVCRRKYCVDMPFDTNLIHDSARHVANQDKYHIYPQDEKATKQIIEKNASAFSVSEINLKDIYLYLAKYGGD